MYLPTSLCAGLGRGVAGVRGQEPLDTGEAQLRFPGQNNYCHGTVCYLLSASLQKVKNWMRKSPEFPSQGEMIEGFQCELLLAAAAASAMIHH